MGGSEVLARRLEELGGAEDSQRFPCTHNSIMILEMLMYLPLRIIACQ